MTELVFATRRLVNVHAALLAAIISSIALLVAALHYTDALEALVSARLDRLNPVGAALLATLFTALATGAGALPLFATRSLSARTQTSMLGFSAGIMLAAGVFSLLLPALESATEMTGSKTVGGLMAGAAVLLGASLLMLMDRVVPHEHDGQSAHGREYRAEIRRVWLFVFAITLHNLPEGLAIGVAFAAEDHVSAIPLALGIAVQNAPEGLAVALAMLTLQYSRAQAVLIALATGMVEPIGGLIGAIAVSTSPALLPWGLGFAAGAMLFVISHEMIPESHRHGRETMATVGLFAGFVVMMLFDTTLS